MSEIKARLPAMWNAYGFTFALLLFVGGAVYAEVALEGGIPEPLLILIGTVVTPLTSAVTRTVKYYTNGADD